MKPVGKPDAANPHVRFDERGWETGRREERQYPRPSSTLPSECPRFAARLKPCPDTGLPTSDGTLGLSAAQVDGGEVEHPGGPMAFKPPF